MLARHPGYDGNLLKAQYARLRDALDGYYSGKQEQVLNVAATLRVLIHDRPGTDSRSLLSRLNPNYWDLTIYDQTCLHPKTVYAFDMPPIILTEKGINHLVRPKLTDDSYELVPLKVWWTSDYQPIGILRVSKETIVRNVADKDGGTHLDGKVPFVHVALSQPPFRYATKIGGQQTFMAPNMAYIITARAGCELQECMERHFPFVK